MARIERETKRRESAIVNRRRVATWRTTRETAYVIASLYPEEAGPEDLLAILRGHWTVEALHWIRDVTCGEDQSQVRTGKAPNAMASLRNLAISLIRAWGFGTVPDGQRHFAQRTEALFSRLAIA